MRYRYTPEHTAANGTDSRYGAVFNVLKKFLSRVVDENIVSSLKDPVL